MEQATAQYWMLMKRKQDIVKSKVSLFQARSGESWEERAFAEDHAAFMWPPRSYSCTFCKREFRSAQALGGHMNVHRRDRAMLKQSLHLPNTSPAPSLNLSSYPRRGLDDVDGDDHIETDLSVGCKRPKLAVSPPSSSPSPLEFLLKPCFQAAEKNVGLNKASSMEDLDLELRLGHHDPLAAGYVMEQEQKRQREA